MACEPIFSTAMPLPVNLESDLIEALSQLAVPAHAIKYTSKEDESNNWNATAEVDLGMMDDNAYHIRTVLCNYRPETKWSCGHDVVNSYVQYHHRLIGIESTMDARDAILIMRTIDSQIDLQIKSATSDDERKRLMMMYDNISSISISDNEVKAKYWLTCPGEIVFKGSCNIETSCNLTYDNYY